MTISTERCDLLGRVADHYHRTLRESTQGQEYLTKRRLTDPDILTAFQAGYVDGSLLRMIDPDTAHALREIGLLTVKGRELFAGCVVFPLTLPDLGVVGLYGRHIRRDQHLYLPGLRRGVFHWQAMKGSSQVILAESVIDAVSLYQVGIRNVAAVYGSKGLTDDHEELLQRFRVSRVFLCLENGDAGTRATEVMGGRLRELGIEAIDARVHGVKDPNELLVKFGPEAAAQAFRKIVQEARRKLEPGGVGRSVLRISTASPAPPRFAEELADEDITAGERELDTKAAGDEARMGSHPTRPQVSPEEGGGWWIRFPERSYRARLAGTNSLEQLRVNLRVDSAGQAHIDTLDLYSHRGRSRFIKELAQIFAKSEDELVRELSLLIEVLDGLRLELRKKGQPSRARVEIPEREREAALQILRSPDLIEKILADFERIGFVGEKTALTVCHLATVSRLLDEPLGILIISRSGAGKSSLQDVVCDFVPEEFLAKYTQVTGQALFYKDPESLLHKVLAVDEEKGAEDAGYSLRILQSAQVLSIAATRTDPQTGKLRTEEYRVKGPVSIFLTTTAPEALDYETRNRFVQVGIDESAEQTRRILERQRQADTLEGVLARQEADVIRLRHHNMQRLLRPLKVVNRYAPFLSYPDHGLQMRREQKKYLTLIKAIALLHQHQREIKHERRGEVDVEYIEVTPQDITLANRLAREILGHNLDELAHPTRDLLRHLVRMAREKGRTFTRQDVREATGWSDWSVRVHLAQLVNLESVVVARGGNGKRITYELLFDGDPDEDRHYLAGLVDVEESLSTAASASK